MKRDESLSSSFFTFRSRLTCSPRSVLRFYDCGLSTSEDKQIFVVAGRLLELTRHLTGHSTLGGFMTKWQLQEAKARFSELIDDTLEKGPQVVTRRGIDTAVVVSIDGTS